MLAKGSEYTTLVAIQPILAEGDRIRITRVARLPKQPYIVEYNFVRLRDNTTHRGYRLKVANFW